MPLELWVQAAALGLKIVELPVPLIYLEEDRSFGGSLDNAATRLGRVSRGARAEPGDGRVCPAARPPVGIGSGEESRMMRRGQSIGVPPTPRAARGPHGAGRAALERGPRAVAAEPPASRLGPVRLSRASRSRRSPQTGARELLAEAVRYTASLPRPAARRGDAAGRSGPDLPGRAPAAAFPPRRVVQELRPRRPRAAARRGGRQPGHRQRHDRSARPCACRADRSSEPQASMIPSTSPGPRSPSRSGGSSTAGCSPLRPAGVRPSRSPRWSPIRCVARLLAAGRGTDAARPDNLGDVPGPVAAPVGGPIGAGDAGDPAEPRVPAAVVRRVHGPSAGRAAAARGGLQRRRSTSTGGSHRIRSTAHPVPDLAVDGPWLEAPYWVWTADDPRRRRLFARRRGGRLVLSDRHGLEVALPLRRRRRRPGGGAACWNCRPRREDPLPGPGHHALGPAGAGRPVPARHRRGEVRPGDRRADRAVLRAPAAGLPGPFGHAPCCRWPDKRVTAEEARTIDRQLRDLDYHPESVLDGMGVHRADCEAGGADWPRRSAGSPRRRRPRTPAPGGGNSGGSTPPSSRWSAGPPRRASPPTHRDGRRPWPPRPSSPGANTRFASTPSDSSATRSPLFCRVAVDSPRRHGGHGGRAELFLSHPPWTAPDAPRPLPSGRPAVGSHAELDQGPG